MHKYNARVVPVARTGVRLPWNYILHIMRICKNMYVRGVLGGNFKVVCLRKGFYIFFSYFVDVVL